MHENCFLLDHDLNFLSSTRKIIDICSFYTLNISMMMREPKINNRWGKKLQSAASFASSSSLVSSCCLSRSKTTFLLCFAPSLLDKKIQRTTAHSPQTSLSCCSNNVIKWKEFLRYNLEEWTEHREMWIDGLLAFLKGNCTRLFYYYYYIGDDGDVKEVSSISF